MQFPLSNAVIFFITFAGGFALGSAYFGVLWWTVRQLPQSPQPVRLFVGSFVSRVGVLLLSFYWVMDGRWERMVACLVGFIVARTLLIRRFRPRPYVGEQ